MNQTILPQFQPPCGFGRLFPEDHPRRIPLLDRELDGRITEVVVEDFLQEPGDQALYTYDYGDGWRHDILFEGRFPKEPGKTYPLCLAGELAGPPEDCGGVPGYYDCIKALKKRDNSEGLLDWLGAARQSTREGSCPSAFWPLTHAEGREYHDFMRVGLIPSPKPAIPCRAKKGIPYPLIFFIRRLI